jgi:hypothetical protein
MTLASFRRVHAHPRRLTTSLLVSAAAFLTLGSPGAQALPVIPGAAGFGIDTPAGRGGRVYRVTNLNASGAGSLKACIDGTTARVCIFEVSGIIRLTSDLIIRNSRLTIAGQTAPSPGIMLRGASLRVHASDVLIQHIRVRPGDDPNGPPPVNRDALKIEGSTEKPVRNVVIDHCSFSWSIDEVASVWGPHDNITLSNNIFSHPLHDSLHPKPDGTGRMPHGYGVLLGSSASGGRISMIGNLLAHQVERNPLTRARQLVFVNNLVYDRVTMDYDGQSESGRTTQSSLVGNVFVQGPSYERPTKPIYLRTSGTLRLGSGSRVYVNDDYAPDSGSAITQLVAYTGGSAVSGLLQTATVPVWNSGLIARKTANNAVYDRVLSYAGARPADRDSVDRTIVAQVKARNGGIINCVAANGTTRCNRNAGGWPWYGQHTRRLTLPAYPNTVRASGYTNLENWLQSMSLSIQGTTTSTSPAQPASAEVR